MKGIPASVYRSADGFDCSNHGLSSRVDRVLIVHSDIPGVFDESPDCPAMVLVQDAIGDGYHLEPAAPRRHFMFGGNFAFTSDSRVRHITGGYAIRIHDRLE